MVVESTCGGIGADFDLEIEFEGELRFLVGNSHSITYTGGTMIDCTIESLVDTH